MVGVAALTQEDLESWLVEHPDPLLVAFYSRYCLVCQRMQLVTAQVADDLSGCLTTVKVDITDYPDLVARHGIRTVPTIVLFRGGRSRVLAQGPFTSAAVEDKVRLALGLKEVAL
jgi:thioredoxin-like negative regulator of GroEL